MIIRQRKRGRVGILDNTGPGMGGAQLVVGHMAALLSRDLDVELIHGLGQYSLDSLATAFCLNLSQVKERCLPELNGGFHTPGLRSVFRREAREVRNLTEPYDLFICAGHGIPPPCFAKRGLVYCHFPFESAPLDALADNALWRRRSAVSRLIRSAALRRVWRLHMQGYQMILANSRFTATWLQRRWGKAAEVLYPPVELDPPTVDKKNIIVSVGRITGDPRNKNQLEQVKAFREFVKSVGTGWTLRIIGSCRQSAHDQDYLKSVQRESQGLPVELLVNVDRTAVLVSMAESKLFWHTTGLLTDENERPEDAEHFGIATVEAMRAGCVPVVIASGGQREIVENGVSGFLANDLDELVRQSITLARDVSLSSRMSEEAKRRSEVFSGDSFDKRFNEVLSQCLSN